MCEGGGGFGWRLAAEILVVFCGEDEQGGGGRDEMLVWWVEMTVVMRWQRRWCCGDDGEGSDAGSCVASDSVDEVLQWLLGDVEVETAEGGDEGGVMKVVV
ncbi:hypothetical protein Tco_1150533 [Tanacetum coccineum]